MSWPESRRRAAGSRRRRVYERTIEGKEKWLYRLFFLCCVLVAVLLGVLIYDLTHPMVGFFRQ